METKPATRDISGGVADAIGRRIVTGEFPPGALLPTELDLCAALGVSRPALREGFRMLAAKGMILSRRKRGAMVQPRALWNMLDAAVLGWHLEAEPNEDYIDRLFEARMVVEPAAASMAARRAVAGDIETVAAAFADMRQAQRRGTGQSDGISETVRADLRFHEAILAACGNHFFASFGALIGSSLIASFRLNWRAHASEPELSLGQHEAVLAAIRDGDPARAGSCMRALLESAARDARQALAASRAVSPAGEPVRRDGRAG